MNDHSLNLRGKNAVITGATGVIGGAMAMGLMRHGANVSLTYRSNRIRVNCIAPGFFPGPRSRGVMTNEDGSLAWRGEQIVARTPMGRLGHPEDIVGTMLFYVSGLLRYVTGTMIPVDGGFTADVGI
ncbi:SDR family oxidoreductase [Rhodobacteraceae bacterium R_SAG2]|nr:SDR family oxidoreductase [Rhodobacteraceae bacterium R_SAG2]